MSITRASGQTPEFCRWNECVADSVRFFQFSRERELGWPFLSHGVGWIIMFPQSSCLPRTSECLTLFGIRVFTDVIKVTVEMRPYLIRWCLLRIRVSLYQQRKGDKETRRRWCGMEAERLAGCVYKLSNTKNWQHLPSVRREEWDSCFLRASRRKPILLPVWFWIWVLLNYKRISFFSCFKPISLS